MPRVLVIESCLINHRDDRGGVHAAAGEILNVAKDTAGELSRMGRVLYASRDDDPSKDGRFTASPQMLQAAEDMGRAKAKAKPAADPS